MKKLLFLMLLAMLTISVIACQNASDSPKPPETIDATTTASTTTQQPTVTTTEPTVTTTEPTVTTTEPIVTQPTKPTADSVIIYDSSSFFYRGPTCTVGMPPLPEMYDYQFELIDDQNDDQEAAAICLVTVTEIEPSWDIEKYGEELRGYQLTPIHMRIDRIYKANDYFEFQESDEIVAIDQCHWFDHGDGSYTVSYWNNLPLTQIGGQYIVRLGYSYIISKAYLDIIDGQQVLIEGYKDYFVIPMTIPINESIDDEEYRNEWHEKLGLPDLFIEMSNRAIEELYKSENG